MSQTDLFVTLGSAAVIVLMLSVAWVLGFRQSARLDDGEVARLAGAEGANVEASAIDARGRAAVAKLNGGKLLIAKVMADGISARARTAAAVSRPADRHLCGAVLCANHHHRDDLDPRHQEGPLPSHG